MKKVFVFFMVAFGIFCGCDKKNADIANALSVVKKDVDSSNVFMNDKAKFISLFFVKTSQRTIVQVATFFERPTRDNTKCYYKQDSTYIYICCGYCEEFRLRNHFEKWNDSLNKRYLRYDNDWDLSDSLYESYQKKYMNIKERFYEYDDNIFVRIDSISNEEIDSVDSQAVKFDIGYLFKREATPPDCEVIAPFPIISDNE